MFEPVRPEEWLTESGLTDRGREVRAAYERFAEYLDRLGLASHQAARVKYFLTSQHYHTLPDGYSLPPHTINLCVNNVCNLKCRYCDFGQKRENTFYYKYNVGEESRKEELPLPLLQTLIDQLAFAHPIIRASYREPMLYKPIFDLIAHTKARGLPFWLLTNGFNLRPHAKRLVELGVDSVRLSLDGPEAVHDEVCQVPGAYRRMMDGVKELLAIRRELGARTQVGFYFTITDANFAAIEETVDALAAEGILKDVFVSFQWLLYTTKRMAREHNAHDALICGAAIDESTVQSVDLGKLDLARMSAQARSINARFPEKDGYRIHFRPSFEESHLKRYVESEDFPVPDPRCMVPFYDLTVNPAGEVRAFHHCLLPGVGSIYKAPALDCWNGETMRAQRRLLQEHGVYRGCARCWGVYSLLEDQRRANERERLSR